MVVEEDHHHWLLAPSPLRISTLSQQPHVKLRCCFPLGSTSGGNNKNTKGAKKRSKTVIKLGSPQNSELLDKCHALMVLGSQEAGIEMQGQRTEKSQVRSRRSKTTAPMKGNHSWESLDPFTNCRILYILSLSYVFWEKHRLNQCRMRPLLWLQPALVTWTCGCRRVPGADGRKKMEHVSHHATWRWFLWTRSSKLFFRIGCWIFGLENNFMEPTSTWSRWGGLKEGDSCWHFSHGSLNLSWALQVQLMSILQGLCRSLVSSGTFLGVPPWYVLRKGGGWPLPFLQGLQLMPDRPFWSCYEMLRSLNCFACLFACFLVFFFRFYVLA